MFASKHNLIWIALLSTTLVLGVGCDPKKRSKREHIGRGKNDALNDKSKKPGDTDKDKPEQESTADKERIAKIEDMDKHVQSLAAAGVAQNRAELAEGEYTLTKFVSSIKDSDDFGAIQDCSVHENKATCTTAEVAGTIELGEISAEVPLTLKVTAEDTKVARATSPSGHIVTKVVDSKSMSNELVASELPAAEGSVMTMLEKGEADSNKVWKSSDATTVIHKLENGTLRITLTIQKETGDEAGIVRNYVLDYQTPATAATP